MKSHDGAHEEKETRINRHPTAPLIVYPSGKSIIVCSVLDPSDSFVYKGHSSPTTIAKFSPNGVWVVSGDSSGFVRIWSWSDVDHLTKLATQLFTGPVSHIDWDVESKIVLALGENRDSDTQVAKSLNFDTMAHSISCGSPSAEMRSPFISSLSPREKISISVRNDFNSSRIDELCQSESDIGRFSSPYLQRESAMAPPNKYASSTSSGQSNDTARVALASSDSEYMPASPQFHHERNGIIRSLPLPSRQEVFTPTTSSSTQIKRSPSRSETVLDRLRAVEGTLHMQVEHNTLAEGKIQDLHDKVMRVDGSIHPAVLELQQRFDRELGVIRRENESRNAFQCEENVRLQQHMSALSRENEVLKRKVEEMASQLMDVRTVLGDCGSD